ncbi:MAG: biosynthetic-type acetolactate synthase large subunit [Lachnospiraceae bacterium]|nr:biosynthetic-type acetolactate synthase large subunit [Lachnospiraceae bacterium]
MNGAEALVKCLEAEKVEYVFSYPGAAICPFFDALLETDIKTILVRQEQNCAHEASGYARMTGKVGVACVTSGPGATNLITGIATAFADSVPLVCLSGQVESRLMGTDGFQEADISGSVESFVKYSYIVHDPADIPRIVKEAFYIAGSGRKGPVLIDLPFDMQTAEIGRFVYPEKAELRTYKPTVQGHSVQIKKVIKQLERAEKPLICVGGGVHLSDAVKAVRQFIGQRHIPVVSTMMGLGVLPSEDPDYFGMVGNNGSPTAMYALKNADTILMVGARVADRTIRDPNLIAEKMLIHIDVDPAEIGKNAGPAIPLVGDIRHIFNEFNKSETKREYEDWHEELASVRADEKARPVKRPSCGADPRAFIRHLSLSMDENGVYIADVGQNQIWSCKNAVIRRGRFMTSGGMGTMGYALPAAIGARLACPDRQVVAVCGDGAFQMTMMELATARQYQVPVKLVILSNKTLGLVRQYQNRLYRSRYTVTTLEGDPDLEKLAEAYGMAYLRIDDDSDVDRVTAEFLKDDRSTILECVVDPDLWV